MPTLVGQTLGGFRLIQQIGLGGMATVFKAYQPAMDRFVALKVIADTRAHDATFVQRFQQEARVIAKLEHAHILPVYEYGHQEGYFFLAMRLIETGTLSDRLKAGSLSLGETRRIVTQVGSALAYAHRLGIIHRDFKPSNILVDAQGNYYLTDFGIAKMMENTLGLTAGGFLGTPHYMAPEQGRSLQVDHRADIYAMGVVVYELVTGQVPYNADTPFAIVLKHISEPLPSPRAVRPALPEGVEQVILKALAKDPADRYQTMASMVAAFQQAVDQLPAEMLNADMPGQTAVAIPTSTEQAPAPAATAAAGRTGQRRFRWGWPVAAVGLLAIVLAAVIYGQLGSQAEVTAEPPALTNEETRAAEIAATLYAQETAVAQAATATPTPTATSSPLPPTFTPAPTAGYTPTSLPDAVVNADVTNLWAGPGGNYDILGQAKNGDPLRITGRNSKNDWLQVVAPNGVQGWIAAMWLQVNAPLDGVAVVAAPPLPSPTPTIVPTFTPTPPIPTPIAAIEPTFTPTQPPLPSPTPTPVDATEQLIIQEILKAPLLGGDKSGVILVNCQGPEALDWYIEEPKSEYRLVAKIPAPYEGHCGVSHLEGLYVGVTYEFGFLAPWLSGLHRYSLPRMSAGQVGVMYYGQAMEMRGAHADLKARYGSQ